MQDVPIWQIINYRSNEGREQAASLFTDKLKQLKPDTASLIHQLVQELYNLKISETKFSKFKITQSQNPIPKGPLDTHIV